MSLISIITVGIFIILALQFCATTYFIGILMSERNNDDCIVHEVDFDELSKEEQEALIKVMNDLMED